MTDGQLDNVRAVRLSTPIERIARWWTSASAEERFALLRCSIHGDPSAPSRQTLSLAIYLAEATAGEVAEG